MRVGLGPASVAMLDGTGFRAGEDTPAVAGVSETCVRMLALEGQTGEETVSHVGPCMSTCLKNGWFI